MDAQTMALVYDLEFVVVKKAGLVNPAINQSVPNPVFMVFVL
jgi:hypothetical protein